MDVICSKKVESSKLDISSLSYEFLFQGCSSIDLGDSWEVMFLGPNLTCLRNELGFVINTKIVAT